MKWINLFLVIGILDILFGIASVVFGSYTYARGALHVTTGLTLVFLFLVLNTEEIVYKFILVPLVVLDLFLVLHITDLL